MTRCESRVSTRLRYVQKSVEIIGSPKETWTTQSLTIQITRSESATNAHTESNAPNGASVMKPSESGEVLVPTNAG